MVNPQFNRREFNSTASVAIATTSTTNPLAHAYLNSPCFENLVSQPAASAIGGSNREAAIERMCRKIVLNDCADSLVRQPQGFPDLIWQQHVQTFEELGGVPGSFPELLRHAINKPGKFAQDSLVTSSAEARRYAIEKINDLSQLPTPKKDLGQSLRTLDNPLGRRLDLMYRLRESNPESFRAPIIEASLWYGGQDD